VVAGVSIYLVLPCLLAVFGSWGVLSHLDWPFAVLVLACEAASFVCLWELDRIALRMEDRFPVAAAQLRSQAVTAFGASTMLQIGTALALPVLALPAILGGAPINHSLVTAAYLGAAVLVLLIVAAAILFTTDAPLELAGRALQWLLNKTVRRRRPVTGLPQELLADRDFIRATIGAHWRRAALAAAGNTVFDYLALLAALRAVGADPQPSLVLLAYTAAELLALLPFTPGGLGFVEAGLVGMLRLAGVPGQDAFAATLLYRIVSFWLPLPAGGVAYLLFHRRYDGLRSSRTRSAGSPMT
jgi:uncharacterized protein (TIRG00374 family)